jgi:uncharacterized Zn finger protein (UPF0148 family)
MEWKKVTCAICGKEKYQWEFISNHKKTGVQNRCKECRNKQNREYKLRTEGLPSDNPDRKYLR